MIANRAIWKLYHTLEEDSMKKFLSRDVLYGTVHGVRAPSMVDSLLTLFDASSQNGVGVEFAENSGGSWSHCSHVLFDLFGICRFRMLGKALKLMRCYALIIVISSTCLFRTMAFVSRNLLSPNLLRRHIVCRRMTAINSDESETTVKIPRGNTLRQNISMLGRDIWVLQFDGGSRGKNVNVTAVMLHDNFFCRYHKFKIIILQERSDQNVSFVHPR